MSVLDKDIREDLEKAVNQLFENSKQWERMAKDQLKYLNITPSLDSALALFWGIVYGTIRTKIWERHGRITSEEMKEIIDYALKKWPELKEFYIAKRILQD